MSQRNLVVAIIESSYIIRKGIVYAISQIEEVEKVVELQSVENLKSQIELNGLDVLIINPLYLGISSKQDLKSQLGLDNDTIIIALIYSMIDQQLYKAYDDVILINDSKSKIISTVKNLCLDTTTNINDVEELSDREKEILISVVKGMSNKEIADYHSISIHTVITHRRNITRKLKVHSISGLTIYAIINKLVDITDIEYQDK